MLSVTASIPRTQSLHIIDKPSLLSLEAFYSPSLFELLSITLVNLEQTILLLVAKLSLLPPTASLL